MKVCVILMLLIFSNVCFSNEWDIYGLTFEENKGQIESVEWNQDSVYYILRTREMKVFFTQKGVIYQFERTSKQDSNNAYMYETFRVDYRLVNANPDIHIVGKNRSQDVMNYYNKNTLNVHHYDTIIYQNVYDGIDWKFYEYRGNLKHEFIVKPKGDYEKIKLKINYADSINIVDNILCVYTKLGNIEDTNPIAIQSGRDMPLRFH